MTSPETARFQDGAIPYWGPPGRYLVRCPRCSRRALVQRESGFERTPSGMLRELARVTCEHCGYSHRQSTEGAAWQAPVDVCIRTRCGDCGRWLAWQGRRRPTGRHSRSIPLRCEGCGATTRAPVHLWLAWPRAPQDPWFGLPLWLQTSCCGQTLWAVNEGHLQFLRDYVGATLRERAPNRNGSLPSRLPTWMKLARNRSEVLACLQRLEESLREG